MNDLGLSVEKPGALSIVVDSGRFGVRHLGITQGGAQDWIALGWANWLLGNSAMAPALEVSMGGFSAVANQHLELALCGADLDATINDKPLAANQRFILKAGERLSLNKPHAGLRAYLAFKGGLDAPLTLGSASSVVREKLGGLDQKGTTLQKGDQLIPLSQEKKSIKAAKKDGNKMLRTLPQSYCATPVSRDAEVVLDLIIGAQIAQFEQESIGRIVNQTWLMDKRADRMGVRLLGEALSAESERMISEGIPLGAVQVPADGQPIILLNDRQTIGGYPRIGAITPIACAKLAQCVPGQALKFRLVTAFQAREAHLAQWQCWA